jgi:hypothetical protein
VTDHLPDTIGIVGSRGPDIERGRPTGWNDYPLVLRLATKIQKVRRASGLPATIISGGAPSGVDAQVRLACRNLGFCFGEHLKLDPTSVDCPNDHFHEIRALWNGPDGRGPKNRLAGFERNDKLVRHCGLVLALFAPGEWTPGTSDVVRKCREHGVPVLIYHEGAWR